MQILRTLFRITVELLRFSGRLLLSLLRLYRLALRIRRNTAAWEDLPAQSGSPVPVGG